MTLARSSQAQPQLGKIIYKKHLTEDLAIIRLQPENGSEIPDFKPGQFVTLGIKLSDDGKITNRAYSIASPPEEKRYFEFYIKWATEPIPGKITSIIFKLKEGDTIFWRKPAGAFTIEENKKDGTSDPRRLILVASGTGLAPFISYITHLRKIGMSREIVLLHGARYAAELGYKDILENLVVEPDNHWNFKYVSTVSRPDHPLSKSWKGNTGRVETLLMLKNGNKSSEIERLIGENITPQNSFFYICGYQGTINAVISLLTPLGFVTNRNKRKDGSFDIKIETYG
jgi:ferredoxin--NADP+ reductase